MQVYYKQRPAQMFFWEFLELFRAATCFFIGNTLISNTRLKLQKIKQKLSNTL